MEPTGVRCQCPQCTLSCVMRSEQDMPENIRKVVEGVPFCPNCDLPMKPVASVPPIASRETPGLSEGLSLAERLQKIREGQSDVTSAKNEWDAAKERAATLRKVYDGKVETLGVLINRLTSVSAPVERGPLLERIDNPACICTHLKDQHDQLADGEGCRECVCELFELPEETAVMDETVMNTVVRLQAEEIRQQLAKQAIVVDIETIQAWDLEQYDAVVKFLSECEAARDVKGFAGDIAVPLCLPSSIPDHIGALHAVLRGLDVPVMLADVCAWTEAERATARAWGADPDRAERPDFVPAPGADVHEPEPEPDAEPARYPSRRRGRRKKDQEPVHV